MEGRFTFFVVGLNHRTELVEHRGQLTASSSKLVGSLPAWSASLRTLAFGFVGLFFVSAKDPRNHWPKFILQLCASGRVLEFHAFAFTANQTSLPKNLEML